MNKTYWMFTNKIGDVMNDIEYNSEFLSLLRALSETFPRHQRKLIERNTKIDARLLFVELLLKHGHTTLLNFVLGEAFEIPD